MHILQRDVLIDKAVVQLGNSKFVNNVSEAAIFCGPSAAVDVYESKILTCNNAVYNKLCAAVPLVSSAHNTKRNVNFPSYVNFSSQNAEIGLYSSRMASNVSAAPC